MYTPLSSHRLGERDVQTTQFRPCRILIQPAEIDITIRAAAGYGDGRKEFLRKLHETTQQASFLSISIRAVMDSPGQGENGKYFYFAPRHGVDRERI